MPPSKTVAQFKCGDFSTCDAPSPGRPKTVTTPEIIDQIHELILEDRRAGFRLNEYLRNWASHMSGFGLSFMKIWTCGSSPRSGSRNPWTRIKNVNGVSRLSNFRNFFSAIQVFSCRARLVTMDETWLYYYDPKTNKHSMEWRHSDSPRSAPKNFECKNPLEKFSPWFLGIKTASSSLIIFQSAKLSTRGVTYLCWCNWREFWKKIAAGRSSRWSCSCTTMPWLTGNLQPRRSWPTCASNVLITHPILRIWPRQTTTCSLDWKNNWKVGSPFFVRRGGHCCRRDLVGRTTFWFFFWVACKN